MSVETGNWKVFSVNSKLTKVKVSAAAAASDTYASGRWNSANAVTNHTVIYIAKVDLQTSEQRLHVDRL